MRLFSYRKRPVHLGPWPLERLTRLAAGAAPDLEALPPMQALSFDVADPDARRRTPGVPAAAAAARRHGADVARFELVADEPGTELPPFEAGAHIDVVIAPE